MQNRTFPGAGQAMVAGAAGALALTAVHQLALKRIPNAPRMDVLGMRALNKGARALGVRPPTGARLYRSTLAGDLIANSLYYALVGASGAPLVTGLALGAGAGIGALVLPPVLGLGRPPHSHSGANQAMTVAWYVVGGLVAAIVQRAARSRTRRLRTA